MPPQESDSPNLHGMISKRAYELHCERGYRDSGALADGLDAEQGILKEEDPVSRPLVTFDPDAGRESRMLCGVQPSFRCFLSRWCNEAPSLLVPSAMVLSDQRAILPE